MTNGEAQMQAKAPKNIDQAYADLAAAIVLQAVKDLVEPDSEYNYQSARAFFNSEWAVELTLGHLDDFVSILKKRGLY